MAAPIDGRGDDFVGKEPICSDADCAGECDASYCAYRFVAANGRTGAALWASQRFYQDDYRFHFWLAGLADLTGDGRAEVILHGDEGCCDTKRHTFVLRAEDGRILWMI
jgi:hypothetical protein